MKIGILTFHRSQNYGALLQAKALQDYVSSLGHDVSFVDYWPAYHEEMYKPFSWQKFKNVSNRRKVKYIFQSLFTFIRLSKRRAKTRAYVEKFLKVDNQNKFDLVLYGSDQIWRKQHEPTFDWYDPVYWGEGFVECNHKVAYAASMGKIEIDTQEDKDFVSSHLSLFDGISIREKGLMERIKDELGCAYPIVCDPVFLLSKEQWIKHVDKKYIPNNKYILYYRLQRIKMTDDMVEELRKQTGYDVVELRGYIPFFHYGKRYRFTADAQELISLIYGAEYVVTSSFHGISMSIIYEKQFFFTSQKHLSNRVESLLNQLGLSSRFAAGEVYKVDTKERINYEDVKPRLEAFAGQSRVWLNNQIENTRKMIAE